MKSVSLTELPVRRNELLEGLARGEVFAVTDDGREIATLSPSRDLPAANDGQNALDLVADLVGTAEGPADLSNKKKYLAGFSLNRRQGKQEGTELSSE